MLGLSQVLFVPTAMPPHKQAEDLAPAADRFELCRMAVRDHPFCRVNDTEIRRGGKSYTVDTLRILTEQYPDTRLFLLMGARAGENLADGGYLCRAAQCGARGRAVSASGISRDAWRAGAHLSHHLFVGFLHNGARKSRKRRESCGSRSAAGGAVYQRARFVPACLKFQKSERGLFRDSTGGKKFDPSDACG